MSYCDDFFVYVVVESVDIVGVDEVVFYLYISFYRFINFFYYIKRFFNFVFFDFFFVVLGFFYGFRVVF